MEGPQGGFWAARKPCTSPHVLASARTAVEAWAEGDQTKVRAHNTGPGLMLRPTLHRQLVRALPYQECGRGKGLSRGLEGQAHDARTQQTHAQKRGGKIVNKRAETTPQSGSPGSQRPPMPLQHQLWRKYEGNKPWV